MMNTIFRLFVTTLALLATSNVVAQNDDETDPADQLKIAALEALMTAPDERALPLVQKVLNGNNSAEVKESALFVLSQIDLPEAQQQLLQFAHNNDSDLREEAVRMIGIGGDEEALAGLADMYASADEDLREAILEAYLIADETEFVANIAKNAKDKDEFEAAVEMLAVMGATEELRALRSSGVFPEALIEAFAISGDFESLRELALDNSDLERQAEAIEALGIVGGDEVDQTLMEIYKSATSEDIREAALEGMFISGYDKGVLELYRASDNIDEKRELLEVMSIMGSDYIFEIIDAALEGDQ